MSSEKSDTRSRILQSVLKLLEADQGKSVPMSDIAKTAGISRQALYLHFASRTKLLIAATRHLDEQKESDARLAPSRQASSGKARLDAFIVAWGNYIPEIYPIAKALLAMADDDKDAADAWRKRMQDMREGCEAAILALDSDGTLASGLKVQKATDMLWALLSVRNWELYIFECGWSQKEYIAALRLMARRILVKS